MRSNDNKTNGLLNRLLSILAAQKKKGIIAAVLISLMVFMWVRLLAGKGTQSARASVASPLTAANAKSAAAKAEIVAVELPFVQGRHDVLARDFFRIDAQAFGAAEQVSIVSGDVGDQSARQLAQRLRLEAICMGPKPQAFINDKLVTAGETLVVVDGSKSYECEVKSIKENSVLLKYGTTEVELKLKEINQMSD